MTAGKRAFDITCALCGLIVLSPLLLVLALAIRLDSAGPVIFRQERIGRDGRRFLIWKLRTMTADAERSGPQLTVGRDARITRVGWALRAGKLDELPQLINVLRGEMTFVGPRPEVPRYVALYDAEQRAVLALVPGITDLASIAYRRESELLSTAPDPERMYVERIMPEKIRLNLAYARTATRWTDLQVILRTLVPIGAAAATSSSSPRG
jgi:lipopolysaccharide/colanic/teichoic acid biosynthesis glycosyltransferase